MPQVPVFNREVQQQNTATPYQSANLNGDMFGASIAAAQGNLGKAIGTLADTALKVQNYTDETKILEYSNKLDKWEQDNLYDKENGYYYKMGKDAAGKGREIMQSYERYAADELSKLGVSPRNQAKAQYMNRNKGTRISYGVNSHDFKETKQWQTNEATTAIDFAKKGAIDYRYDEPNLEIKLATALQAVEILGTNTGMSEDAITANKLAVKSDFYKSVLKAQIADGSLAASKSFGKWKDNLTAKDQEEIYAAIQNNETSYMARNQAQQLMGMDISEAYKAIDSIGNIKQRDATEREYERLLRNQNAMQAQKDKELSNQFLTQLFDAQASGANLADLAQGIMASDMSIDMKDKMLDKLKTVNELGQFANSWADEGYLDQLAAYNAQKFKEINLANFNLNKESYQKYQQMQQKIATAQYSSEIELKKAVDKASTNFLPFGGLSQGDYKRELMNTLHSIELKQGGALDLKNMDGGQIRTLLNAFDFKSEGMKDKDLDEFKEVYMRAKKMGDVSERMANKYMEFKAREKREPEPNEMYSMALSIYTDLQKEEKVKIKDNMVNGITLYNSVLKTQPKAGETKVLTYFYENELPAISNKLGIRFNVVEGGKYRAGDAGGHGKGRKIDISMSEHSQADRVKAFSELITHPLVASIGTSDKYILNQYAGNPKVRDLRDYDRRPEIAKKGINHVNHLDVSLNTRYGGEAQGKL